jgi:small ligand-binding sensory domain FIST
LPLAGMQSSFEVSEVGGKPALQLYTGVLGVFTAPS